MKTVISGGTVVTASETYRADVLIEDEQVVLIGQDLAHLADKVVDATGKLVMPGAIDVHTHLDMPFGGTTSCDDFTTGHVAALHGGTTMHIDFSTQPKGGTLQDGVDTWHAKANGKAVMDYGFHMIITDARPEVIEEMDSMVEQGVTSFKLFLAYPGVFMVDDDTLFAVMEKAASNGGLVMMHCENGHVIDTLVKRANDEGNTSPGWHYRTRPSTLDELSLRTPSITLPTSSESSPSHCSVWPRSIVCRRPRRFRSSRSVSQSELQIARPRTLQSAQVFIVFAALSVILLMPDGMAPGLPRSIYVNHRSAITPRS